MYGNKAIWLCYLGKDPKIHASVEKGNEVLNLIVKRLSDAVLDAFNKQSNKSFDQIYNRYDKIKTENRNLERLFETYGISDKREGLKYLIWKIFKKGKFNPKNKQS